MRNMMLGVAGGVAVTLVFLSLLRLEPHANAQQPRRDLQSHMLMAHAPMANGGQQIVVLDTEKRVIGSYHVSAETGEIALRSVRNIGYDLLMEEFNGGEPKPRDIRALLEQK